ncbi:hypothetical protein F5Y09DRAFT_330016 [Xylaria sp. FL1042]|nr:hypothetical protein F5Y09DRAFT_330016 [Xylaria sp. FL1042]
MSFSHLLHQTCGVSTATSIQVPQLQAPDPTCSTQPQHVRAVSERLKSAGVLKIRLAFPDDDSQYLKQLILSLHKHHGHTLPITHSESRGWFWDIRPSAANFQTANCQARSETMEEFPWHTDCSYENPPPKYFALQVLQPDRYGGGVLSLMNVQCLSERLSSTTRAALMCPEYRITTPAEFYKQSMQRNIIGSIFATDYEGRSNIRFRGDIITPLSSEASRALEELKECLTIAATDSEITMNLSAVDLPENTIVLVNNRRWLHARTDVKDPERHLRRIRWGADVLAVARIHPFYNKETKYPPDACAIRDVRKQAVEQPAVVDLNLFPLLWKSDLYTTIERLVDDTSFKNTYRHSVYASTTGGGYGSKPLFFATDTDENRRQRATYGQLLRTIGIVTPGDWILTVHSAGELYRSLDLVLEVLENAGASVLSGGNHMSATQVAALLVKYHVNVLTGDSSQIIQIVHHIPTLSREEREQIKLDKIIYTSEILTSAQRAHIGKVLGQVKIFSLFASAEAGPWTASNPDITGHGITPTSSVDFIFDTRTTLIEIFPLTCTEADSSISEPLPDGEKGLVVQTSLTRLRNPLVRYVTGDVGSLHPLPDRARALLSETDWQHLRVLRLAGRDRRFSFDWDGEYIEFEGLTSVMETERAILQWQVILGTMEPSKESSLEVRILCAMGDDDCSLTKRNIVAKVTEFLHVYEMNCHRFQLKFVDGIDGFERSTTGRKVIKFIDRYNKG